MIAWEELWLRSADYSTDELFALWRQAEGMTGDHAFHLLFGQRQISEIAADQMPAGVTTIAAVQKGAAPVTVTPVLSDNDTNGHEGDLAFTGDPETNTDTEITISAGMSNTASASQYTSVHPQQFNNNESGTASANPGAGVNLHPNSGNGNLTEKSADKDQNSPQNPEQNTSPDSKVYEISLDGAGTGSHSEASGRIAGNEALIASTISQRTLLFLFLVPFLTGALLQLLRSRSVFGIRFIIKEKR